MACAHRDDRACRDCLSVRQDQRLTCALRAAIDADVVVVTIDGVRVAAAFDIDSTEHARRHATGVGAVTATSLLHGLWLLPSGVPVPAEALPDHKREPLSKLPALVAASDDQLRRTYEPAGVMRAVACGGRSPGKAIEGAARFSPIFRRYAAVAPDAATATAVASAISHGVGVVETDGVEARIICDAPDAVLGVPAVYRWWVAELTYEAWLYESTQPVS